MDDTLRRAWIVRAGSGVSIHVSNRLGKEDGTGAETWVVDGSDARGWRAQRFYRRCNPALAGQPMELLPVRSRVSLRATTLAFLTADILDYYAETERGPLRLVVGGKS